MAASAATPCLVLATTQGPCRQPVGSHLWAVSSAADKCGSRQAVFVSLPGSFARSSCRDSRFTRLPARRYVLPTCQAEKSSDSSAREGGEEDLPAWAQPGSNVPPPWARGDKPGQQAQAKTEFELPFGLYLLFSVLVCIAAVGSIFEFSAKNPLFGVIPPDNPIWAPVLLFFAITGFPTTAFLLMKAIAAFNKFAEEEDRTTDS